MGEIEGDSINILEEIQKIYSDVSEWLKFLEAKHAAVFAVWTALFISIITSESFEEMNIFLIATVVIIILIGASINLVSFIPFLNRSECLREKCYKKYKDCPENLVFYQSIFVQTYAVSQSSDKTMSDAYKDILEQNLGQSISDKLTINYMQQIVDVSSVATIKAYLFSKAVGYAGVIIVLVIVAMIIA